MNKPWLINPLGPDTGPQRGFVDPAALADTLIDLLTPQVGAVQALGVAQSLAEALTTGVGRLDAAGAAALVSALSAARLGEAG